MSLEVAAKHLAAHGRHGDSTLVHMNHKEVAGLQALARSKGKSLSTNPHTGLPEAFNLGQELGNATSGIGATVTGAALAIAFPELAAMGYAIPAIVGGTHYATTGNAGESVMGGIGAYGGQNLAGNVMGAGTSEATAENIMNNDMPLDAARQAAQNTPWYDRAIAGTQAAFSNPNTIQALGGWKTLAAAAAPAVFGAMKPKTMPTSPQNPQMIRPYTFDYNAQYGHPSNPPLTASYVPGQDTSERQWFAPTYTAQTPYKAADGGIIALAMGGMAAGGGPVELMSNQATTGANTMYPMANMTTSAFATPYQTPQSTNMMSAMAPSGGGTVDAMSGEPNMQGTRLAAGGDTGSDQMGGIFNKVITPAQSAKYSYDPDTQAYIQSQAATPARTYGTAAVDTMTDTWNQLHPSAPIANANAPRATSNYSYNTQADQYTGPAPTAGYSFDPQTGQYTQRVMAAGGITDLGGYSDGGRLLKGPGDGVSDSIPAQIGNRQPARLADGEFVVPARIVSELGNGSTEAGARQLYKMLDRVQNARGKTTGKNKVAHNTNAAKYLPA